jgi:hypothetical protein
MPTLDPADFLANNLRSWSVPAIVYRAVGKYSPAELRTWLAEQDPSRVLAVLVGAASTSTQPATSLAQGQALSREANPGLVLGGVAIPNDTVGAMTNTCGFWRSRTRVRGSS